MESATLTMDGNVRTIGHDGHVQTMSLREFVVEVVQNDLEEGGPISRLLEARYGLSPSSATGGDRRWA